MRIRELLEKIGMTQKEAASKLGIAPNTFNQYTTGKREPDNETLIRISEFFDVTTDYLLGKDAPDPSNLDLRPIGDIIRMRVTASISAGYNGLAEVFEDEYAEIPVSLLKGYAPKDIKILRVKGDSMYPRICAGDLVVMHVQESVDPGDIAVVIYNGDEATIKKINYVYGEDWMELIPFNPEFKTRKIEGVELEQCKVLGKVLSLMRDF